MRAGEALIDGSSNPHDILRVLGEKKLAGYLVDEIQEVGASFVTGRCAVKSAEALLGPSLSHAGTVGWGAVFFQE